MTALVVARAGPGCTLQDAGRAGFMRYGITPAGPMDWVAHATANIIAGNPPGAAAVEVGPGGIAVTAQGAPLRLGVAAPGFVVAAGRTLPARVALTLHPGETLDLRPGTWGQWAYVAVAGGFALDPVMGSLATHTRSGIGPNGGRALAAGDALPARPGTIAPPAALPDAAPPPGTIRFIPGPQADAFTPAALAAFARDPFTVAPRSDRMGLRLTGPRLAHARGHDIVSDGIAMGAIQVPGDGQPIVLMADRQSTGGYPKIGTVIRADLPALAQARAGSALHFRPVTWDAAVAALRAARAALDAIPAALRPLATPPDPALLISGDHASGFVDARDPDRGG